MPIYEYKCNKCGNIFEEITFSSTDSSSKFQCPTCKSKDTCRLMSSFSCSSSGSNGELNEGLSSSCGSSHGGFSWK